MSVALEMPVLGDADLICHLGLKFVPNEIRVHFGLLVPEVLENTRVRRER